jgi:transposase-like protein
VVTIELKCPFCGSNDVRKYGNANGKKRYMCNNLDCSHKTFYAEYTNKGCRPDVKSDIIKLTKEGMGIRAIARQLEISTDTVISVLKKRKFNKQR